jgi:hypothetical protein
MLEIQQHERKEPRHMVGVSYYSNDVYGAEMTPKFDV